jgi:hypothetical protein
MSDKLEKYFVEEISLHNMKDPLEILNWYRNLYYKEASNTERGIVANAINDLIVKYKSETSQCHKSKEKDEYWGYWIKCECGYDMNTSGAEFCGGCGKKINVVGTMDFYPDF